ncbi:MAG: hypothetical protein VKS61_15855 [Candidatus Sericytochromatia bacterium]|nr:hypothetical protein [Candidatus Sericytochromatia bacterium]
MSEVSAKRVAAVVWIERALWVAVLGVLVTRCVLPSRGDDAAAALAPVRVATDGRPVLVVFDGSR